MGRGNTIIRDSIGNTHPTYYIDYYEHDDSEESSCDGTNCYCNDSFLSDVLCNIRWSVAVKITHLEETYGHNENNPTPSFYRDGWNNDYAIFFESNVMQVIFSDNESSMAIGCVPKYNENDKPINLGAYKAEANKFMRLLNEIYALSERTSAWTSGKIEVQESDEIYIFY